jgi:hypothetical protein
MLSEFMQNNENWVFSQAYSMFMFLAREHCSPSSCYAYFSPNNLFCEVIVIFLSSFFFYFPLPICILFYFLLFAFGNTKIRDSSREVLRFTGYVGR